MVNKKKFATDQQKQDYVNSFVPFIKKHNHDLPFVDMIYPYSSIKHFNSWFSINETSKKYQPNDVNYQLSIDSNYESRKTIRVELYPNKHQQLILHNWFHAYTEMFNASIRIIRSRLMLHDDKINKKILDFKHLRTTFMLNTKSNIIERSILNNNIKTKIPSHVLDMAIQDACICYKSHTSNFKNGNIKEISKVRYWCFNRNIQTIKLVKDAFSKKGFTALGLLDAKYNNEPFDLSKIKNESLYNVDPTLQFNRKTNRYYLYIPIKQHTSNNYNPKNIISLDPGIRTFLTGVNEVNNVEIGKDAQLKIRTLLSKIDKINNLEDKDVKIKKESKNDNHRKNMIKIWKQKKLDLHRRKISQYVDELHWKTINYLTKNYKNIVIGDMSVKSISSKDGNLARISKRIGYSLKFYKFKQRLAYKCGVKKIGYKEVDESYTSKLCSKCGNEHKVLGSSKIYCCIKCGLILDRDINGARNIYIKSKMLE